MRVTDPQGHRWAFWLLGARGHGVGLSGRAMNVLIGR
ncbi:hypothetical protein SALBM311S_04817 [Streptomyces alboniger]